MGGMRTCKLVFLGTLVWTALLLVGRAPAWAWMQAQEPGPIDIQLHVPTEIAPETAFDVVIKYDAVDLNASADINYNLFGPAHIISRDPVPPDPAYNTWVPRRDNPKGTIRLQLVADRATEGQAIQHQVQVRWGPKERVYQAETKISHLLPTVMPTSTPQQKASQATATPSSMVTGSIPSSLELERIFFTGVGGKAIDEAYANQEIGVQVMYMSAADLGEMEVAIRFDPDVVELETLERVNGAYVLPLDAIVASPSAPQRLFETAVTGRIRPALDRGEKYPLRARVELRSFGAGATEPLLSLDSAPLTIGQLLHAAAEADLEAQTVRAGGSVIVHAVLQNAGQLPITHARLSIVGLPEGFSVNPKQQSIAAVAPRGGIEERLFTIHTADNFEGLGAFRVVATVGEASIESESATVQVVRTVPLTLEVLSTQSSAYAGESVQLMLRCTNNDQLAAPAVRVRLIDRNGNLETQFQEVGDIGAGESRDLAFVVQVPRDLSADTALSLVAQAMSSHGSISTTPPIPVAVACVPQLEVSVQPITGKLRAGQSAEAIVLLRNASVCPAHQVSVSVQGLPQAFAQPASQQVFGLETGATRHLAFNVLIPQDFRGQGSFVATATDSAGNQVYAEPRSFLVSGTSTGLVVAFGALALLAVTVAIFGIVFYLRSPG